MHLSRIGNPLPLLGAAAICRPRVDSWRRRGDLLSPVKLFSVQSFFRLGGERVLLSRLRGKRESEVRRIQRREPRVVHLTAHEAAPRSLLRGSCFGISPRPLY
eukprot:193429-Prorocentrum_minimum.AAC.1